LRCNAPCVADADTICQVAVDQELHHGSTPLGWALHDAAPDDRLIALLGGS
jgi:hypothetical protein